VVRNIFVSATHTRGDSAAVAGLSNASFGITTDGGPLLSTMTAADAAAVGARLCEGGGGDVVLAMMLAAALAPPGGNAARIAPCEALLGFGAGRRQDSSDSFGFTVSDTTGASSAAAELARRAGNGDIRDADDDEVCRVCRRVSSCVSYASSSSNPVSASSNGGGGGYTANSRAGSTLEMLFRRTEERQGAAALSAVSLLATCRVRKYKLAMTCVVNVAAFAAAVTGNTFVLSALPVSAMQSQKAHHRRHSASSAGWLHVLHAAAMAGEVQALRFLHEELGHPLNCRDAHDWTPLHYAAFYGHAVCACYIVERSRVTVGDHSDATGWVTAAGWTVAHVAAATDNAELIDLLAVLGTDFSIGDRRQSTAAHVACEHQHHAALEALARNGAVHADVFDACGMTAADIADMHPGRCADVLRRYGIRPSD
jgi:hypothetical protein